MARAHAIYIIRHKLSGGIVGAWTVKRELTDWIARNQLSAVAHEVVRLRDNNPYSCLTVPWHELGVKEPNVQHCSFTLEQP